MNSNDKTNTTKKELVPEIIFTNNGIEDEEISYKYWKEIEWWLKSTNDTKYDFGYLLKLIGIDETETCTLIENDYLNFNFHLEKSNEDITIKLGVVPFNPYLNKITIKQNNISKTFHFNPYTKKLTLQIYSTTNETNTNTYTKYLKPSSFEPNITLTDNTYTLSIELRQYGNDEVLEFKNENELEKYLLNLSFPIDLGEVYKKICEHIHNQIETYNTFELKVEKKIELDESDFIAMFESNDDTITTDLIYLHNGKINKFIITRNGKTISFDNENNTSYQSDTLYTSKNNGTVNLSFTSLNPHDINNTNLLEKYNNAEKEIEETQVLAKRMINYKTHN